MKQLYLQEHHCDREGGGIMLTKEELLILGVAATDGLGEYFVSREYNERWSCAEITQSYE